MSDTTIEIAADDSKLDVARRLREAGANAALVDATIEWMAANPGKASRVDVGMATITPMEHES